MKLGVIYGPVHLQGMGFKNLYTQLGAIHCDLIIRFYSIDIDLGQLLQTTLKCIS